MKTVWRIIGFLAFFVFWPYWLYYFRKNNQRTRVLLVSGGKLLLVKGWLGTGNWSLPGGGMHKSELVKPAGQRELNEETGILLPEENFDVLGRHKSSEFMLSYTAHVLKSEINDTVNAKTQFPEITESKWVEIEQLKNYRLSKTTKEIIEKFL